MKKTLLCLLTLSSITVWQPALAQKEHNNWYFGEYAGITFNTAIPTGIKGSLSTTEGVAAISDKDGDLLFYTDGMVVYDRHHNQMFHGFGLAGGFSSAQSAMIIPAPDDPEKYYVFTAKQQNTDGGLSYSIVDMTLQNGAGDIVPATKNTLLINQITEQQTAIQHSNKRDIWIITHALNADVFYAFLLTSMGITTPPVISHIGTVYGDDWFIGQIRPSHNGRQMAACVTYENICELFEFDAATGKVSHGRFISFPQSHPGPYGLEFSPNDSLLYISTNSSAGQGSFIYQYGHQDPVPKLDTVISLPDGIFDHYGTLQLGPDNKLYITRIGRQYLDIIHAPDQRSADCQFEAQGISLIDSTRCAFGLPWHYKPIGCQPVTLGQDVIACLGDSVELTLSHLPTAECPFTFTWSDGSGEATKTITQAGTYWVDIIAPDTSYSNKVNVSFVSTISTTTSFILCEGGTYEGYTQSGIYVDTFITTSGCDSIRTLQLTFIPSHVDTVVKTILQGQAFEGYTSSGIYSDSFITVFGCDSFRTLYLTVIDPGTIVHYTLNACESVMAHGTHMDYSEFTPIFPDTLPCAITSAQHLYRVFPEKHSCTPGVDGMPSMCVTGSGDCDYEPGNSKSVIIEFTIEPAADSVVHITQFNFYEKSPFTYSWINGPSGPNNRPLYYGIRILKNAIEIFRNENRLTQPGWNIEAFPFHENIAFRCDTLSHFRIELLPYCSEDNGAFESVWDLDQINILGGCVPTIAAPPHISGTVRYDDGQGMPGVRVELSSDPHFTNLHSTNTDADGKYVFNELEKNGSYYVRCFNNDGLLLGVSVADLVHIRKHLLGIDPYTSLKQLVAADINRNNIINALDIVTLQKALLGRLTAFPNNTSWRFGVLPQDFSIMNLVNFRETHYIESLNSSVKQVDFVGIKVGNLE